MYAVTTAFPQALAASMGFSWQATDQLGVYNLILGKLTIIVIVTKQIPKAPHNLPWNLLSQDPEHVRYALNLDPLPPELRKHFENLNW
ncbi:hypothetical protein TI04_04655 [Achromatium sp. WMS2]|nr:hypothetical protein TI04_04655 [Achromatium sp. WMS2]